jgi:hypothetical protein
MDRYIRRIGKTRRSWYREGQMTLSGEVSISDKGMRRGTNLRYGWRSI